MYFTTFIFSILMIFSISTTVFLKKASFEDSFEKSISGYMSASRKLISAKEYDFYKSIKKVPKEKDLNKKDIDEMQELKSNKIAKNSTEGAKKTREINTLNAKVNIYKLGVEKKENHKELYNLVARLIKNLYSNKSFYHNNLENIILDNILKAIENQKNDKNISPSKLVLKTQDLQKVYYKMLKGSKFYDFEKGQGTASLVDFLKIENSKSKIPIIDASYELLESAFSKKIANQIKELQKEDPPKNLTRNSVLTICQKNRLNVNETILDLFDFSSFSKDKNNYLVGIDENTNIKITKKIKK